MAVDGENCDPMNLYRWPEGAHVKNLEIDPRLLCTVQKWSYLCSLLLRFCLLRSPFRDAVYHNILLQVMDETLVVFTSDNGPSIARHELGGCAGLLRYGGNQILW